MSIRTLVVSVVALSVFAVVGTPASREPAPMERHDTWRHRMSKTPLLGVERWTAMTAPRGLWTG